MAKRKTKAKRTERGKSCDGWDPRVLGRKSVSKRYDSILAIDPSIAAMGVCLGTVDHQKKTAERVRSFCLKPASRRAGWVERVDELTQYLTSQLPTPNIVLIEQPSHYSGGVGDVAKNSGAILKLMALVFAIRQAYMDSNKHVRSTHYTVKVILVPVTQWKGNTPKKITQNRIFNHWGLSFEDHNEADAVGIFDWFVRRQLKYSPKKV